MEYTNTYTRYSELFYINNQYELLKLKANGERRYLIKDEIPVGAVWRGDNESSAFYAYIASQNPDLIRTSALEAMNVKLLDKISGRDSLKAVIAPLLGIVERGWYQIFYHEPLPIKLNFSPDLPTPRYLAPNKFTFLEAGSMADRKTNVWIEDTIIFTQDVMTLDQERISLYRKNIKEGKRPTIITMGLARLESYDINGFQDTQDERSRAEFVLESAAHCIEPQFVLDGHHKAMAYMKLKERPSIISLVKLQFKEDYDTFLGEEDKYKILIENKINDKIE